MPYPGVHRDVKACIDLRTPSRYPAFALSEEFDVRAAGISYQEYSLDADKILEAQSLGIEEFGYDWANVYIDDCLEFEPLGVQTVGAGDVPRAAVSYLPAEAATLAGLRAPDPHIDGRLPILLEGIAGMKERWGSDILLCGRVPAPFSSVTLLCGIEAPMFLAYDDPSLLAGFVDYFVEQQTAIGIAQLAAGADALWVGDCSASSRFLSLGMYRELALSGARRLVAALRAAGGVTIYFAGEGDVDNLTAMAEVEADILGLSEDADIFAAKDRLGTKTCLMGNIDPIGLLRDGTPAMVEAEVGRIRDGVSARGGHMFNTGEGITPDTPPENVAAMIHTIQQGGD